MRRATKTLIAIAGLSVGALLTGGCPELTDCPDCGFGEVEYEVPDDCEIGEQDEVTAELDYTVTYDDDNCPKSAEDDNCRAMGTETISDPAGPGEKDRVGLPVETAPDSSVSVTVTYTITGPGQPNGMTVKEVPSNYMGP